MAQAAILQCDHSKQDAQTNQARAGGGLSQYGNGGAHIF
jgi:hypothetical protein